MTMEKDSLIIVSGGMDSITLLYDRKDTIALAVSFDYGSNHNAREIPFAQLHCQRLGIRHVVIPLAFKRVLIANHGGDHAIYPDCRPEFIAAIDAAAKAGTYVNVAIEAPYTNITKTDIALRGKSLGIDYSETWSCYKGGTVHCGTCGTCVERKEALRDAGIEDNTTYLQL